LRGQRRRLANRQLGEKNAQHPLGFSLCHLLLGSLGPVQQDHEFTSQLLAVGQKPALDRPEGTAAYGFELLGEFPGHDRIAPGAEHRHHVREALQYPVRALVENKRARVLAQLGESLATGPGLGWGEPFEYETVGR